MGGEPNQVEGALAPECCGGSKLMDGGHRYDSSPPRRTRWIGFVSLALAMTPGRDPVPLLGRLSPPPTLPTGCMVLCATHVDVGSVPLPLYTACGSGQFFRNELSI